MEYIIIGILIIAFLLFYFKIIDIGIVKAKFEDESKIQVINNSFLDTFKHFINKADYEYITGKIIFFNTWASWCSSCIKEISILNQLQLLYKNNEKIAFISYCNDLETSLIPAFIKKRNLELNYRFLTASEGLRVSLSSILSSNPDRQIDPSIDSVPINLIIDQNEKVLFYKRGSLTNDDFLIVISILNELLPTGASVPPMGGSLDAI